MKIEFGDLHRQPLKEGISLGISVPFTEDTSAVFLSIDAQLPSSIMSLVIPTAEIIIIEVNPIFSGGLLGDGFNKLVPLIFTDQEGGGEGVKFL